MPSAIDADNYPMSGERIWKRYDEVGEGTTPSLTICMAESLTIHVFDAESDAAVRLSADQAASLAADITDWLSRPRP